MGRALLINAAEREEIRAALVDAGRIEEFQQQRATAITLVGNLYSGRIVNLETGIGAAFVDVGEGRNAFLHISDCAGFQDSEEARIADHFTLGDEVLVQVTRDSIGSKGPVLSANVSLAGRFAVLLPCASAGGISRRIEESQDRSALRALARELEQELGVGLILRTASAKAGKSEVKRDVERLVKLWERIRARARAGPAPRLLHAERDLVARALRDMLDGDVDEIVVDTPEAFERAAETIQALQPEFVGRLRLHESARPLFHARDIETQVDQLHARRVSLSCGGSIVFDTTEALVAVDVNSGRTRHEAGLEETALATNLDAAAEIARQLRLRDLGGVVVVDFIDMRDPDHVRQVEQAFKQQLALDRAHLRPGQLGAFGIFVLTRQRTGGGTAAAQGSCPRCGGTGQVTGAGQAALRAWRELMARAAGRGSRGLKARVSPEVARSLEAMRSAALRALAEETGLELRFEADPHLAPGDWRIDPLPAP